MLILYIQIRDPVSGQTRQQEFQFDPAATDDLSWLKLKTQLTVWAAEMPASGPTKLTDLKLS